MRGDPVDTAGIAPLAGGLSGAAKIDPRRVRVSSLTTPHTPHTHSLDVIHPPACRMRSWSWMALCTTVSSEKPPSLIRKALRGHALSQRVLRVAEVRNKQLVVAQIAQRAGASADETRVHAHQLALKARLQLLHDFEKELSTREWEKRGPLAIEGFFVALLEDGEKVLLAPVGTMASVVPVKSVGSPISTTPTWRTRLDPCPSGSSSKTARRDARGTQLHHVTGGGRGLLANNPRWYTPPFDPRSPPSCSTTHSSSDFPL